MGTGGISVQPQTGRESSGRIELINGPRGDISLTILLVGLIGIGAAVTRRPLPDHRAYGSVHGGSRWLR